MRAVHDEDGSLGPLTVHWTCKVNWPPGEWSGENEGIRAPRCRSMDSLHTVAPWRAERWRIPSTPRPDRAGFPMNPLVPCSQLWKINQNMHVRCKIRLGTHSRRRGSSDATSDATTPSGSSWGYAKAAQYKPNAAMPQHNGAARGNKGFYIGDAATESLPRA